jgi:hypothetical protein
MRIRTILILGLITLVLALAAGCGDTKTGPADTAKAPPAAPAAPVARTTAAAVPSVQTASIQGNAMVGCAPGMTACGNACINLKTNSSNCGSCGNACPAGQPVCKDGQCGSA